jgi:hypothetical protein
MNNLTGANNAASTAANKTALPPAGARADNKSLTPKFDAWADEFFAKWDAEFKAVFDKINADCEAITGTLRAQKEALANELDQALRENRRRSAEAEGESYE